MKNFGKIISDKDIITKEYLDSKGYISAINSKMVTDALGFTPFDSAAFTKASIKNALGIADWALAASKPSYDDVYLKLAGGTINGNLTVSGQFKAQTSLASVSLLSNIFDVNASLKVQPGWNLYLNGEAIMKWSDLKSKIAYSFSEISSKPTTLDGYGITDAVKWSSSISSSAPDEIGYGNPNDGWKTTGPAACFGTAGYVLRLQAAIDNTDRPKLYASFVYNNTAKGWAELVTFEDLANRDLGIQRLFIKGDIVLYRPGDDVTYLNYGAAINDKAMLYVFGTEFRFYITDSICALKIATDKTTYFYGGINLGNKTINSWNEFLSSNGGTINGGLAVNGTLEGKLISSPANPSVISQWRIIPSGDTTYIQAGTAVGNTGGTFFISGYSGNAAKEIKLYATNITAQGSLAITGGINLGGRTISNWDQVKMTAWAIPSTTGSQSLTPNNHYTFSNVLTSSSNISITLTDDTSGESITKIYYIVFRTGATTPTFTFNRTLYWKDGKGLTALAANKRYRIVIDKDLATLETYS